LVSVEHSKGSVRVSLSKSKLAVMQSSSKILAFSPHPDDSEEFAGGFLCQAVNRGARVKIVVVSDGRKGSHDATDEEKVAEKRRQEQEMAAKKMGAEKTEYLGYKDTEVPQPRIMRDLLMSHMRLFGPQLVVTLDPALPNEAHLDHVYTGIAVMEAVLLLHHPTIASGDPVERSKRPYLALAATHRPNVIVNIEDTIEKKVEVVSCHSSQIRDPAAYKKSLLHTAIRYGKMAGCKYGEAFRVLEPQQLHCDLWPEG
jgi:LmbE family N-acetylglucosaminyl deacetylase